MSDVKQRIEQIFDSLRYETAPNPVEACEEAIRLADSYGDVKSGITARYWLIKKDQDRKALVALAWIWGQMDNQPDLVSLQEIEFLLGNYLDLIDRMVRYPNFSIEQLNRLLDDVEKRVKQFGYYPTDVEFTRRLVAWYCQDLEKARKHYFKWKHLWKTCPLQSWNCTYAWYIAQDAMDQYRLFGDLEKLLEMAKPILEGQYGTHPHEETAMYTFLVLPLFFAGRKQEANQMWKRAEYNLLHRYRWFDDLGWMLEYLVLSDQLPRAISLFEEFATHAVDFNEHFPAVKWDFAYASAMLFRRLQQLGKTTLPLRLPKPLPVGEISVDHYDVETLYQFYDKKVKDLALQFDKRNHNDAHMKKYLDIEAKLKQIDPINRV